jgi:hypothetical protein
LDLQYDRSGVLHFLGQAMYRTRGPNGNWSEINPLDARMETGAIATDAEGLPYILWTPGVAPFLQTRQQSSSAGLASMSQTVTIPADMHKPTLSLMYRLQGKKEDGQSKFQVAITDSLATTQVLTPVQSTDWQHIWYDLSPWSGQSIEISFRLNQSAGEPLIQADIDDISLGSWMTPVVESVSTLSLPQYKNAQITIVVENLTGTPTARLGNVTLLNTVVLDGRTVRATIPETMSPGIYPLQVINPGGQPSPITFQVKLGSFLYLPVLGK